MRFRNPAIIAVTALVALLFVTIAAEAGRYAGFVTARSQYGNGTLRAPVRIAQFGQQVRLPGGTWVYCERSSLFFDRHRPCSETLRRQSLDFWETISEESPGK